jgi:predicted cation transporter
MGQMKHDPVSARLLGLIWGMALAIPNLPVTILLAGRLEEAGFAELSVGLGFAWFLAFPFLVMAVIERALLSDR